MILLQKLSLEVKAEDLECQVQRLTSLVETTGQDCENTRQMAAESVTIRKGSPWQCNMYKWFPMTHSLLDLGHVLNPVLISSYCF